MKTSGDSPNSHGHRKSSRTRAEDVPVDYTDETGGASQPIISTKSGSNFKRYQDVVNNAVPSKKARGSRDDWRSNDLNSNQPWLNVTTEEYLKTLFPLGQHSESYSMEDTITPVATRYKNSILCRHKTSTNMERQNKGSRFSGRVAVHTSRVPESSLAKTPKTKIDETSLGFSWWTSSEPGSRSRKYSTKELNTQCKTFLKGFNGEINLEEIAGPHLGYSFVVPAASQFALMSAFKSTPNQLVCRKRMKALSTLKTCYYYQLHWKKNCTDTHVNQSNWRDNPLLDPSACVMIDGYLNMISTCISKKTGWGVNYNAFISLLETGKAGHQAPHLDDVTCAVKEDQHCPFILHHPLCEEGATIQVWLPNNKDTYSPSLLHIPFGTALILRADVYHAGCYGAKGNLRFHAQLNPESIAPDGKFLGVLKTGSDQRLLESDIPSEKVNDIMKERNPGTTKFTVKYLKRMKQMYPVDWFWIQEPEKNVKGDVEREKYG